MKLWKLARKVRFASAVEKLVGICAGMRGQGLTEYIFLLMLVTVVLIGAVTLLGTSVGNAINSAAGSL